MVAGLVGCVESTPATSVGHACEQQSWTVNDVSLLFPLPADDTEAALLLGLSDAGGKGPLLPESVFEEHVQIPFGGLWEGPGNHESYAATRILAARVDPCAESAGADGEPCVRELRLSAQPFQFGDVDAALHLIYRLTDDELEQLVEGLRALQSHAEDGDAEAPLGPHPAMVRQGLAGPFAEELKALILDHAGSDNLVRVTAMQRGRNSTNWGFFLMDRDPSTGAYHRVPNPATGGELLQGVDEIGGLGVGGSRHTTITPLDPAVGYPATLLRSADVDTLSPDELQAALGRLASFEDPARHSAATLDCASCHLANARGFYEAFTGITTDPELVTFASPEGQNTARADGTDLTGRSLRAFGYFEGEVAISQRAVNESATIAYQLSQSCAGDPAP